MTLATQLAAVRSLIEDDPEAVGLIDLCDLRDMTLVDGGAAGDSYSLSTIASNQMCMHEILSGPAAQFTVGGESFTATHRIFMVWSDAAKTLTEKGKIKILARDPFPVMLFEKPSRAADTFGPLAEFKAILVRQGYE